MPKLPTRFTESTVRKLNKACEELKDKCEHECDDVAWCSGCWTKAFREGGQKLAKTIEEENR